jgi:hypothetical protein
VDQWVTEQRLEEQRQLALLRRQALEREQQQKLLDGKVTVMHTLTVTMAHANRNRKLDGKVLTASEVASAAAATVAAVKQKQLREREEGEREAARAARQKAEAAAKKAKKEGKEKATKKKRTTKKKAKEKAEEKAEEKKQQKQKRKGEGRPAQRATAPKAGTAWAECAEPISAKERAAAEKAVASLRVSHGAFSFAKYAGSTLPYPLPPPVPPHDEHTHTHRTRHRIFLRRQVRRRLRGAAADGRGRRPAGVRTAA